MDMADMALCARLTHQKNSIARRKIMTNLWIQGYPVLKQTHVLGYLLTKLVILNGQMLVNLTYI
jgi:hypothetical protein